MVVKDICDFLHNGYIKPLLVLQHLKKSDGFLAPLRKQGKKKTNLGKNIIKFWSTLVQTSLVPHGRNFMARSELRLQDAFYKTLSQFC